MSGSFDIGSLQFVERRWSFISEADLGGRVMVKVHKGTPGTPLLTALGGAEERRLATNEFETLRSLQAFDTDRVRVVPPVRLAAGASAVITEYLPDLHPLPIALGGSPSAWVRPLGDLGEWLRRVHTSNPGHAIDGFKLDNLSVSSSGCLVVFDPNEFVQQPTVTDVARFCVSLLARGYERGHLPDPRSACHCTAFLLGYGIESLDVAAFEVSALGWVDRLMQELRAVAALRLRRLAVVAWPWIALYRMRLLVSLATLVDRLHHDSGVGNEMAGRYDTEEAAATYRRQQDRLSLRTLRLNLLARAEVATIARALRQVSPEGLLLDIPAGTGKLWPLFEQIGVRVVAADASVAMLAQAECPPFVTTAVLDITAIPYADGAFDGAVSLRLLHRLPPRARRRALSELARVSSRWVIVSFAYSGGLHGFRYRIASRVRRSQAWAPHPVTRDELEVELQRAGLESTLYLTVAGLLSNEIVVVARASETPCAEAAQPAKG